MSYSVTLMTPLFDMMGVSASERLSFCCEFESLKNLRDEYIRYCPRTLVYNDIQGSKIDEGDTTGDANDGSGGGGKICEGYPGACGGEGSRGGGRKQES